MLKDISDQGHLGFFKHAIIELVVWQIMGKELGRLAIFQHMFAA